MIHDPRLLATVTVLLATITYATAPRLDLTMRKDADNATARLRFMAEVPESGDDLFYIILQRGSLDDLETASWIPSFGTIADGTEKELSIGAHSGRSFFKVIRVNHEHETLRDGMDSDGDGYSNLEEALAGTGFVDPASNPQIEAATGGAGNRWGESGQGSGTTTLGIEVERRADSYSYSRDERRLYKENIKYTYNQQSGEAGTKGYWSKDREGEYSLVVITPGCCTGPPPVRTKSWKADGEAGQNDATGWQNKDFLTGSSINIDYEYNRYEYSGHYRILLCGGEPVAFLVRHEKHIAKEVGGWRTTVLPENEEDREAYYEVATFDGKVLRVDGEAVSLPTGKRKCKYQYGKVSFPYRVDLDILHPATGELAEEEEDKDSDHSGGYVALKREVEGEDVAPVTQLRFQGTLPDDTKFRLKFDSGGRYRIYKDAARTEAVVSEQTEFPADTETTVYLEGLSVSDTPGGEKVTLQAGLSGNWYATDSVNFTVVDLEFKNDRMSSWKSTSVKPSVQARIGVIKGDTIDFRVCGGGSASDSSGLSWTSNDQSIGSGASLSHTFDATGSYSIEVASGALSLGKTMVTVDEATGPGQYRWIAENLDRALSANGLQNEALGWARNNAASLGGGLHNGNADAARHAYWSGIMTIDWDSADAAGLGTAHEVTNLNENGKHNETVMDLENNADGISMASAPDMTRARLQSAIQSALNAGSLTILEDLDNPNGSGLLQPTTKQ